MSSFSDRSTDLEGLSSEWISMDLFSIYLDDFNDVLD